MSSNKLSDIVDEAYKLFANYLAARPLDICTECCMTEQDEAKLSALPVNQIPKDLLSDYNDGARTHKTNIEEVKHFLPRYLELVSRFEFPTHSAELSFSRLTPFDSTEWKQRELDMLGEFSQVYFKHCLTLYPLPCNNADITNILIMLWKGCFDIHEILQIWKNEKTKESLLHFRDLYFYGFDEWNRSKIRSPFGDKDLAEILASWMDEASVREHFSKTIEDLIMTTDTIAEADLNELNTLYEILHIKNNI